MKNSVKSLLVAAAMTGLLGATAAPVAFADDKPAATDTKDTKAAKGKKAKASKKDAKSKDAAAKDKNSCKSANGCSSKDDKKN